jgi:hypothetical protein
MSTYPEPKSRELTEAEKQKIRERLTNSNDEMRVIAHNFNCSASQVAGIKAAMTKGQ